MLHLFKLQTQQLQHGRIAMRSYNNLFVTGVLEIGIMAVAMRSLAEAGQKADLESVFDQLAPS